MKVTIFLLIIIILLVIHYFLNKYTKKMYKIYILDKIEIFDKKLNELSNKYITYSDYEKLNKEFRIFYIATKQYKENKITQFRKNYQNLKKIIEQLNDNYIEKELIENSNYFDNLFKFPLDIEQKKSIIVDDDENIIIAGAGSGKTSTLIAKIKYLIDKKNINPEEILVLSYSKNTVNDLIKKLNIKEINCKTFHKLGLDILNQTTLKRYKICDDLLENVINYYFKNEILNNPKLTRQFINLFSLYFYIPYTEQENELKNKDYIIDYVTLKEKFYKYKKNLKTLDLKKVKSYEELIIANYLFLNGINYEYEEPYQFHDKKLSTLYTPDFYLPDYDIYIEHFGINKNGRAPHLKENEEKYLKEIKIKELKHKINNTILIKTYSYEFQDGTILNKLKKQLEEYNVKFEKMNLNEIYHSIVTYENNLELQSFIELIKKFILMFKNNNYSLSVFDIFKNDAINKNNNRNKLLLIIIKEIFDIYQKELEKIPGIDFQDMINLAIKNVDNLNFENISYIIVDEFQDISYNRYLLLKAIKEKSNAKLVLVGDDWQSIYRFTGSDLDIFVNYKKYFNNPKELIINNTYRNSQELIDIAGKFIMKNSTGQIKKNLKGKNCTYHPIKVYFCNNIKNGIEKAIEDLTKLGCKEIGILGRNNSDKINVKDFINNSIQFNTVHSSKGLEYDSVIICNLKNSLSGFPNKMSDDPILDYVTRNKDDYLYEEERRLFYVALTRTKSFCFLIVPKDNQSIFVTELLNDNRDVIEKINVYESVCPKCKEGVLVFNKQKHYYECSRYPFCSYTK